MSASKAFDIGVVEIDTNTSPSAGVIGGITSMEVVAGNDILAVQESGEYYHNYRQVVNTAPIGRFTTRDLDSILDFLGTSGAVIDNGVGNPGIVFYFKQRDAFGPAAGASHNTRTISSGQMIARSVSVQQGGNAEIQVECLADYDGTNNPILFGTTGTIPTVTSGSTTQWTIGSVQVAGSALTHITGISIDFGVQVMRLATDGDTMPTATFSTFIAPQITIEGLDLDDPSTLSALTGADFTHANTIIKLRKRNTLDATAEHISFTAAGVAHYESVGGGTSGQNSSTNLVLLPVYDGSLAPIVVSTTATM